MPDSTRKHLLDPSGTAVGTVMSRDVVSTHADMPIAEFTRLLLDNGVSGAPVVDREGRPIGLASRTDLVHAVAKQAEETMPGGGRDVALRTEGCVRDIMTPMAFTIGEEASIQEAASLMARVGLHRLVVVSPGARVIGIVSAFDLVSWIAGIERPHRR